MILRQWSGRARPERRDDYPAHFRDAVLPTLHRVPGFLGAELLQRPAGDLIEFTVQTRWASMQAIHAFAGDTLDTAVIEPGAVAALVDFDAEVRHCRVLQQAGDAA